MSTTPKPLAPQHSSTGGSSMYRWAACPGSVRKSKGIKSRTSAYAAEGNTAHDYAATILIGLLKGGGPFKIPKMSEEMEEAVMVYVDYVRTLAAEPGAVVLIEHKFDLSEIYPGCFGTADVVIWLPLMKILIVTDLKYGAGILVVPEDNPQLKYYALGAMLTCGFKPDKVVMGIVQPRCDHPKGAIRTTTIDALDLYDFSVDLQTYAKATEDPKAPLVSGDHCRFCPAAPTCEELQAQSQALARAEFTDVTNYDPAKLSEMLRRIPAVEAQIKAVNEFAYAEAEEGRCPPGYKLVDKRPTRKWRDEEDAQNALFELSESDEQWDSALTPVKLKSPAKLEKIFGKNINDLVEKKSSGHALVLESDKRPAAKQSAQDAFKDA